MKQTKALGRGLGALIGSPPPEKSEEKGKSVLGVAQLEPSNVQPRRHFDKENLAELAHSISEKGILQPIVVRPIENERYEIVAGERRWRAAQLAKLDEVPVTIRPLSDQEALEIAIIENVQREDLSPIEEALGYEKLQNEFSYTQKQLSQMLGKSRPHIANVLRLLDLPKEVQDMLAEKKLSFGHGRALLAAHDPVQLARELLEKPLSVREVEQLISGQKKNPALRAPVGGRRKDANIRTIERNLQDALGLKAEISHKSELERGRLALHYSSLEQLDMLIQKLCK